MENIDKIKCVLIDFENSDKTLDEAAKEILLLFSVSGRSEQLSNTCECDNVETYNGWGNEPCVRCIDCGRVW